MKFILLRITQTYDKIKNNVNKLSNDLLAANENNKYNRLIHQNLTQNMKIKEDDKNNYIKVLGNSNLK